MDRYRLNSSFVSFFDFLLRLVDIWLPCGEQWGHMKNLWVCRGGVVKAVSLQFFAANGAAEQAGQGPAPFLAPAQLVWLLPFRYAFSLSLSHE